MLFHFFSPDCYVRFWNIWDIHQSLSLSASASAERYSLSKDGPVWQHIVQSQEPQLEQNTRTFHSSQRSHSQLKYQLTQDHLPLQSLYQRLHPLLHLPHHRLLLLFQLHRSPLLHLSLESPYPFQSIEVYVTLCRLSQSILTQQMTALRAHQEQILATQTQHTAVLRQIQHHLGIPSAAEHPIPIPSEPSQAPPFVDQAMPTEPTTGEAETSTWAIIFLSSSSYLHTLLNIVFFMYFLITISIVLPCFWYLIYGISYITCFLYIELSWSNTTLSFLNTLSIILF